LVEVTGIATFNLYAMLASQDDYGESQVLELAENLKFLSVNFIPLSTELETALSVT
jgi:hypothetical protein